MTTPYTVPAAALDAFNCPHCGAYSHQDWSSARRVFAGSIRTEVNALKIADCGRCHAFSLWLGDRMLHPPQTTAPAAHPEMPEALQGDFEEARSILNSSPRGAAALLRLIVQKLCQHLGEPGRDLNTDIGALVKRGLPVQVQHALDVVRVIGNNAVHPGQIDVDDATTAGNLFQLVNIIVQYMIAQPRQVRELYESLPETARAAIEKRDSK
jgi:hypothetical protein